MTLYKYIEIDCLKWLTDRKNKSVNLIITSPPYNLKIKYNSYKDNKKKDEYLKWLYNIFNECKRVLTDDGHLFINMGYVNSDPIVDMEVCLKLNKLFKLQNRIIWIKSISIDKEYLNKIGENKTKKFEYTQKSLNIGHYKPINSKRFICPMSESLFHFTKTGNVNIHKLSIGVPYTYKCNLKSRNKNKKQKEKPDVRDRGNTWFIPYKTINSNQKQKGKHPAIFPEKLVENCIKLSGLKKGIVLDPFSGTGTTVRVAKKMNKLEGYELSGIGLDVDKEYIEFSNKLLEEIK